ncbi:MAG TPA: hypothetical protein VHO01_06055 [Jatrophihabitans sp.]|nr:hypothetical protein [Jatrophihabitans sp.]
MSTPSRRLVAVPPSAIREVCVRQIPLLPPADSLLANGLAPDWYRNKVRFGAPVIRREVENVGHPVRNVDPKARVGASKSGAAWLEPLTHGKKPIVDHVS